MSNDREKGQSAVELALLLTMMALATIGILRVLGADLRGAYCQVITGFGIQNDACPEDGLIFWDDFSGGLENWGEDRGSDWRIEDGELCAGPGNEHRVYGIGSAGGDYTISMDATLKSGQGYGIYFHATESQVNGYTFQYDRGYGAPGAFIFRKWINGREMSPFQPWQTAPGGYQWYDAKRRVVVSARGNTYTATIDGQVVAKAVDDAQQPVPFFSDGRIGLRTWGGEACFDNVQVTVP